MSRGLASIAKRIWPRRDHILIAAFPKSGSTYLSKLLGEVTGLERRTLRDYSGHNEPELSPHKLHRLRQRSIVAQHVKGTVNNVQLMQRYGLRPVVLVRNLFDVVLSLHDHLMREAYEVPTGYVHREFGDLKEAERLDYLIRVHLPWYLSFFMSWREAAERIDTLPLTYERFFADQPGALAEILEWNRLDPRALDIDGAIARMQGQNTRFNKGVTGRGDQLLTPAHKQAIRELARCWNVPPRVFAPVGLEGA